MVTVSRESEAAEPRGYRMNRYEFAMAVCFALDVISGDSPERQQVALDFLLANDPALASGQGAAERVSQASESGS